MYMIKANVICNLEKYLGRTIEFICFNVWVRGAPNCRFCTINCHVCGKVLIVIWSILPLLKLMGKVICREVYAAFIALLNNFTQKYYSPYPNMCLVELTFFDKCLLNKLNCHR